jgi:hypothetical protein
VSIDIFVWCHILPTWVSRTLRVISYIRKITNYFLLHICSNVQLGHSGLGEIVLKAKFWMFAATDRPRDVGGGDDSRNGVIWEGQQRGRRRCRGWIGRRPACRFARPRPTAIWRALSGHAHGIDWRRGMANSQIAKDAMRRGKSTKRPRYAMLAERRPRFTKPVGR